MTDAVLFKLLDAEDWRRAKTEEFVAPSEVDRRDGYIHLSGADQVLDTADRHFAEVADVVALEIPLASVAGAVKYELAPNRGALFPHLYGPLAVNVVARTRRLVRVDGRFRFVDEA